MQCEGKNDISISSHFLSRYINKHKALVAVRNGVRFNPHTYSVKQFYIIRKSNAQGAFWNALQSTSLDFTISLMQLNYYELKNPLRAEPEFYHQSHLVLGFIGLPAGHCQAWANSLEFCRGPITRYLLGLWLSSLSLRPKVSASVGSHCDCKHTN